MCIILSQEQLIHHLKFLSSSEEKLGNKWTNIFLRNPLKGTKARATTYAYTSCSLTAQGYQPKRETKLKSGLCSATKPFILAKPMQPHQRRMSFTLQRHLLDQQRPWLKSIQARLCKKKLLQGYRSISWHPRARSTLDIIWDENEKQKSVMRERQ